MDRRECLQVIGTGLAGAAMGTAHAAKEAPAAAKAPYRLLYNNDSTNLMFSTSPYHKKGEAFRPSVLEASIDEADGVDAHLLMPGMGWVPWWKSKILPIEEHQKWFRDYYGIEPENSIHDFLMQGGDFVQVFVDRCRLRGQAPFISFRLNDGHTIECRDKPRPVHVMTMNKFYMEHPEYRLGPSARDWYQRVQNWAIPEVREYKFAFMQELCENYDLDGFELDLMRHCALFDPKKTTAEQRVGVMTGFVGRVRALLDRTAKPGRRRWLSVRVPCFVETHSALGIDLPAMVAAGVDMVNVSPFYFTQQTHDLAAIRAAVPAASVYLELTHATAKLSHADKSGRDAYIFGRNNDHQLHTSAHMAYEQGADGISLFNFVYYREHGLPGRGPFNEPPFHVFPHLKDPAWLARQPQWYHLGHDWNNPKRKHVQLGRTVAPGATETFEMSCVPTSLLEDGVFRLMASSDISKRRWNVVLNGTPLAPCAFVMKPLDHPYEGGLGHPEHYACFACPASLVKRGRNRISVALEEGDAATIVYMDIVLPV